MPVEPPRKVASEEHLDGARCIHRLAVESTGRHPAHVPAYLRSSKLATPRPAFAIRTAELLSEMGISATRLIMPTRNNLDVFEQLVNTASLLVDMKRQVDRAEQDKRVLEAQMRGFVPKE